MAQSLRECYHSPTKYLLIMPFNYGYLERNLRRTVVLSNGGFNAIEPIESLVYNRGFMPRFSNS